MGIPNQQPITKLDLNQVKTALDGIARNAMALQPPPDDGYQASGPTKDDLSEGQMAFADVGGTKYFYVRIGGDAYRVALVAV